MEQVVGRFAPTPSGEMHLGNLYCAMTSWLCARKMGGKFLLRIEDNDIPRCRKEYTNGIIECLRFFSFTWDDDVIFQSERSAIYSAMLGKIQDFTYPCFCSREEIQLMGAPHPGDTQRLYSGKCRSLTEEERREKLRMMRLCGREPSLRLMVPDEDISFTDMVYGKVTENLARECGDFVLRRSDGIWGYQFASTVDDMLQGVNQVVRGRDILSSTPRQIYLRRLFHGNTVTYCHIPLMTDPDGNRLAKRDSALSIRELLRQYTPEEILGTLAFSAGFAPSPEPVTLEKLLNRFSPELIPREDIAIRIHLD